jgi:hypothetical protein
MVLEQSRSLVMEQPLYLQVEELLAPLTESGSVMTLFQLSVLALTLIG